MIILGLFSPVLHKYICCWYSLGASNEYQHHMFFFVVVFEEIRKNILELSPNPPSLQMEANIYTAIFATVAVTRITEIPEYYRNTGIPVKNIGIPVKDTY